MPRVVYTAGFLTEANKTNISPQVVGMVELSNNAFAPGSVIGHTTYPLPAPYNYGGRLRDVSSLDFSLNGGVGRVTFAISNADLAEVPNVANDNYIGWECKVHKVLILDDGTVTGILLLHGVVTSYTMTDQVVDMDVTTRINVTNSINNRRVGKKCPWVFKGTECGYNGVLTDCNKIYGSNGGCFGRSNQHRFGGFPERESIATIGVVSGLGPTPGYILAETFSEQVITANTTVTATDLRYLKCDHTGPITITLPNPSTFPDNGQPITIKDCSTPGATTNNITVNAAGGGTVNGSTLVISRSNGAVTLSADKTGGDWRIVADYNSSNLGGSVTSVAMTVPSILTVAGSPITSSGTLALSLATQSANLVFAGPTTGAAAAPTFRSLGFTDLPSIATDRLLGRVTASTGAIETITPGAGVLTWIQTPSSANLASAITDETGSGALVFATSPSFTTSATFANNAEIRFAEQTGNGSNYVGFKAPASIASDLIWTLPSSDGTNGQFLSTNGSGVLSWATASGGSITDGNKGDITVSSSGTVWTINNDAVTFAKIQNISEGRLLGRTSSGSGDLEEITPGSGVLIWLQTPSSANLLASVTDETGGGLANDGVLVFNQSPTIVTPSIANIRSGSNQTALRLTGSGSNHFVEIVNATAPTGPTIQPAGTNTNIPLLIKGKGTGAVEITASAVQAVGVTSGGNTEPGILEARGGNQVYGGGKLYLYERSTNGTNYVGFEAPDSLSSDLFWTLPATDGTVNQALITDGGAGLSWKSFEVPLTFSTGLTRSTNTITVNTTQNIIRLSNLTTNGFVKTSGSDGTLSVDTNTYLTGNQTITLSGDVTGSGATSISTTIANNAVTTVKILDANVTLAKIENITANSLLGRDSSSSGAPGAIATTSALITWIKSPSSANLAAAITDETGSGLLVFGTSPTLTTPRIAAIHTASSPNNAALTFAQVASSVNYLQVTNAATGTKPIIEAIGTDSNIGIVVKSKGSEPIELQSDSGVYIQPVSSGSGFYGALSIRGGTSTNEGGVIELRNPGNTGYVGFIAPNTITSSVLYYLPSADGTSGQVLSTNGSGTLSWVNRVTDGDKGDITVSASGATWTIDNNAVTFAKMQNITANRLLGRTGSVGSTGVPAEISVASPLLLDFSTLTFSSQNATHVFAGPTPSFRALNVGDIPDLSSLYLTVGYTPPSGVTSIGMTVPSFLSVTPSTITSSGTFAISLVNQNANVVFAGPTSGTPAVPTFRSLVLADLPQIATNSILGRAADSTGNVEQLTALPFAYTGDVTRPADSNITTIANGVVTLAKMADMATASVFYRKTGGSGAPEVQTLATLKADLGLTGTNSGDQTITLTGDVTGSGTGSFATTIANDAVTYAKMQNISAASILLGRGSASGSGDIEEITIGSGLAITGTTLSASGGGGGAPDSADYLVKTANATLTAERVVTDSTSIIANWATSGQVTFERAALTGDVTATANSNTTTIANDAVTYAKMQDVSAASRLLGRGSASGSGDVQEITIGNGLAMSGTTIQASNAYAWFIS